MIVNFVPVEDQHGTPLFAWEMPLPPRVGEYVELPEPDEAGEYQEGRVVGVRYAAAPAQAGTISTCHALAVLERLHLKRPKQETPRSLF